MVFDRKLGGNHSIMLFSFRCILEKTKEYFLDNHSLFDKLVRCQNCNA